MGHRGLRTALNSWRQCAMARAEALTGLSRLAQHGLRCKRLEAELERMDVFAQLRACVQ